MTWLAPGVPSGLGGGVDQEGISPSREIPGAQR